MYEECSFCAEINEEFGADNNEKTANRYKAISCNVNSSSRVIWENDELLLMPTIGCFTEGYLLLVTKQHYFSIAEFVRNSDYKKLATTLSDIHKMITNLYNGCIFFEHGAINEHCKAGGCNDHAHLHILPAKGNILDKAKKHFEFTKHPDLDWAHKVSSQYLMFFDGNNYFLSIDDVVPSQYFRQLLAIEAGVGDKWDWRRYPFTENMMYTLERIRRESVNYLK